MIQDIAKNDRLYLKITNKPVLLDHDMVLNFGHDNKCYVRDIYPKQQHKTKTHDYHYLSTRNRYYPYMELFNGERPNITGKLSQTENLDSFLDIFNSKSEFFETPKIYFDQENPRITLKFFTGFLAGQEMHLEPNKKRIEAKRKDFKIGLSSADAKGPKSDFWIGNEKYNDIFINDYTLMKNHCEVLYDDDCGWILVDRNFEKNIYGSKVY
jgi:hypothetical protein